LQKDQNRYGLIGLAGFAIVVISALASVVVRIVIFISGSEDHLPIVDLGGFAASMGVLLGFVFYGVATLRARVLPLWVRVRALVAKGRDSRATRPRGLNF
jgi:hypothetical protein